MDVVQVEAKKSTVGFLRNSALYGEQIPCQSFSRKKISRLRPANGSKNRSEAKVVQLKPITLVILSSP